MFERRLKMVLGVLLLVMLVLLVRTFQVQVLKRGEWEQQAAKLMVRSITTETTRGRILDARGQVLAEDSACTDAVVDYRAIINSPESKWLADISKERVRNRLGADEYRKTPVEKRAILLKQEAEAVKADLAAMWATLAQLYEPTADDFTQMAGDHFDARAKIERIRTDIVQQVEARRRKVEKNNREQAASRSASTPAWLRWLTKSSTDALSDSNSVDLAEQKQPHVILHALDSDACNFLGKRLDRFPGLSLRASMHRGYPMKSVACHLLGKMSHVSERDMLLNSTEHLDESRRYEADDVIGREGVEALCEPLLRGTRGKIDRRVGDDSVADQQDFVPGRDVRLTIDADLQDQAQTMLQHVVMKDSVHHQLITPAEGVSMHAAIVVLDVKTNEVRVLASNPGFDVNDLETRYMALANDPLNQPLRDRATSDVCSPGSTAKPVTGIGGITDKTLGPVEGIECTGFLTLPVIGPDGKPTGRLVKYKTNGRCWVESERGELLRQMGMSSAHHPIPYPHRGHDGNPDGWLSYSDALERSCNIFFETVADRQGPARVSHWLEQFGFGRPTGIGIYEESGERPDQVRRNEPDSRLAICLSGIGQGNVQATPLQVANEAATFARDGVWMRPRLLNTATQSALDQAKPPPANRPIDSVDLHLDKEGLRQARIGMIEVVNDEAGTGRIEHPDGLLVAGKTGTAEVGQFSYEVTDAAGHKIRQVLTPVLRNGQETATPWYRTDDEQIAPGKKPQITQDWFMGYAPANDPQIAFAVLVEYAGSSGGQAAGPIVTHLLEAFQRAGYLHAP